MELTRKQEEGLKIAVERYRENKPYTCISGYAGTGKSTLVRFIIAALDIDPHDVAYIAFTGKAAQVLQQKGNPNAMTAHRLLYKSIRNPDGSYSHIPHESLPDYALIVVDEVSMLPKKMWDLLISHHIHVIACGDPFQLPSIGEENDVLQHPHVFLDEIVRQAKESEIIRLTMDIREGKRISPYRGKDINIVPRSELCEGMLSWAEQTICATNQTRIQYNNLYRKMLFGEIPPEPQINERLICLRNNWDLVSSKGDALVNGTIGRLTAISHQRAPIYGQKAIITLQIPDDENYFNNVLIDWNLITENKPTVTQDTWKYFRNSRKFPRPNEFVYANVITCHKSQGSQWSKVTVIEEQFPYVKEEHARWLYTACTRPSEKLTLVLKD